MPIVENYIPDSEKVPEEVGIYWRLEITLKMLVKNLRDTQEEGSSLRVFLRNIISLSLRLMSYIQFILVF
jgi:hypothetical protein